MGATIPYVATRYVPGLSLHDLVVEEGPITGPDLFWLAACLAEGIASVHAVGVLHRDVKPSNVLMEGRTPILIDFGLARVADDPKLTHTGWLLGTPGYLAPEILYGEDATAASDVHSWAATVAYAGTGHPPFGRGPSMAIMDRVRRGQFDLDGLPDDLRQVVAAALDPEPRNRPTLDQLLAWLRPLTTRPRRTGASPPPAAAPHDPYTVPLALAAQAGADDETDVWPGHNTAEPHTLALPPDGRSPVRRSRRSRGRRSPSGSAAARLLVALARRGRRRLRGVPLAHDHACCCSSSGCCAAARSPRRRTTSAGSTAAASGTTACSCSSPRRGTWCSRSRAPCCSRCGASGSRSRPRWSATRSPPGSRCRCSCAASC